MPDLLWHRRRQIAAAIGVQGTADTTGLINTAAAFKVRNPLFVPVPENNDRDFARSTIRAKQTIIGKAHAEITFDMEVYGSGVAGTAPPADVFIRACGFGKTVNSGSASFTQPVRDPGHRNSTVTILDGSSDLTGTYGGTKSGRVEIELVDFTTDTDATFQVRFYPSDGTDASEADFVFSSVGPVSITSVLSGLSLTLDIDPSVSTTGFVKGDRWNATVTSSSTVNVEYDQINDHALEGVTATNALIPVLDMAIFQDGRWFTIHNARGNMSLSGVTGQQLVASFRFMGTIGTISDKALLSGINFGTVVAPTFKGITSDSMFGQSPPQCWSEFALDAGNDVQMLDCATATHGYDTAAIVTGTPTGTINPRAAKPSTYDLHTQLLNQTINSLSFVYGSVSGNQVTVTCQKTQITNITDTERQGVTIDQCALRFAEPEYDAAGNYEPIKLTFA